MHISIHQCTSMGIAHHQWSCVRGLMTMVCTRIHTCMHVRMYPCICVTRAKHTCLQDHAHPFIYSHERRACRGMRVSSKMSQKVALATSESACALQHHRAKVTTVHHDSHQRQRFTDAIVSVCSAAPPQDRGHSLQTLTSTQIQLSDWMTRQRKRKTDDGSASAKLTTGLQTLHKVLHKARTLKRALYALIRRAIGLHKHKMASVPQGATKCAQLKKTAAYSA